MQPDPTEIPYGYCHCGCGGKTKRARVTRANRGHVKGEPFRFIHGHNGRGLPGHGPARRDIRERWEAQVVKGPGCWTWVGTIKNNGYGQISSGGNCGPLFYAHRVSYELHVGPIPEGLQIDHLCRNRACVNPAHLEPVTQRENIQRGFRDRAKARAEALLAVELADSECPSEEAA